jgi:hypothetical protein
LALPRRIAHRHRLDQVLKIGHQRRVDIGDLMPPTAVSAHTIARQRRCVEILKATSDRRARKPCDFGNRSKTATPGSPHFSCRKQAPSPLVKLRAERLPSLPNRFPINHARQIQQQPSGRNPNPLSHSDAARRKSDSVIFESILSDSFFVEPAPGRWCRSSSASPASRVADDALTCG